MGNWARGVGLTAVAYGWMEVRKCKNRRGKRRGFGVLGMVEAMLGNGRILTNAANWMLRLRGVLQALGWSRRQRGTVRRSSVLWQRMRVPLGFRRNWRASGVGGAAQQVSTLAAGFVMTALLLLLLLLLT
jgi:hypothetical protein